MHSSTRKPGYNESVKKEEGNHMKLMKTLLAAGLAFSVAACSAKDSAEGTPAASSMADVMSKETASSMTNYTDDKLVYVYEEDGKTYRVTTELTPEQHDQIDALAYDDDRQAKIMEIIKDAKVASTEDLSDQLLSQEELDKYIGMSGFDLMQEGFTVQGIGYTGTDDAVSFACDKGIGQYDVEVEETYAMKDILDENLIFSSCTVKKITFLTANWNAADLNYKEPDRK